MQGDQHRGEVARNLLTVRGLRKLSFPGDLFDEHAWTMLLQLFLRFVDDEVVSEAELLHRSDVTESVGRRWLAHLVADGQIVARDDGEDVVLTPDAIVQMRDFLDHADQVHGSTDPDTVEPRQPV